jgi:ferredoxin
MNSGCPCPIAPTGAPGRRSPTSAFWGPRDRGFPRPPAPGAGPAWRSARKTSLHWLKTAVRVDESKCLACGQCITACPTETLVSGMKGYRILLGGKLGRHPRLGEELPSIYTATQVLEILDRCLDHYQRLFSFAANGLERSWSGNLCHENEQFSHYSDGGTCLISSLEGKKLLDLRTR